jgi:hypothetical protein
LVDADSSSYLVALVARLRKCTVAVTAVRSDISLNSTMGQLEKKLIAAVARLIAHFMGRNAHFGKRAPAPHRDFARETAGGALPHIQLLAGMRFAVVAAW